MTDRGISLYISKEQSLKLKGIAIIMMLYYHCFNRISLVEQCDNFIYVGDTPLVNWLSRAANPVWIYLFLSGYGYAVKRKSIREIINSIFRIYIHWWVVLFIFFPIGHLLNQDLFNWSNLLNNFSAWNPTYNSEVWFLFPYVLLILCSNILLNLHRKVGNIVMLVLVLSCHFICILIFSTFGESIVREHSRILWMLLMILYMSVPFSFGVLASYMKFDFPNFEFCGNNGYLVVILLLIIFFKCALSETSLGVIYAIPFFLCFMMISSYIKFPKVLGNVLETFGKHSLSMWFIHSFICYHIFSKYLYSLRYPIIIFFVLVCTTYLISIVIDRMIQYLNKSLKEVVNFYD